MSILARSFSQASSFAKLFDNLRLPGQYFNKETSLQYELGDVVDFGE